LGLDGDVTQHYNWGDIPEFIGQVLPKGVWPTTWERFVDRFGYNPIRRRRIEGLQKLIRILRTAGCPVIFIDGSFVTKKPDPGDIDCCWYRSETIQRNLGQRNPLLLEGTPTARERQKILYSCEVFPHDAVERDSRLSFLNYFQKDKRGKPKGIIVISTEEIP
jgi:hypothetical protein